MYVFIIEDKCLRTPTGKSCDVDNIRNKIKNEDKQQQRNTIQKSTKMIRMDLTINRG